MVGIYGIGEKQKRTQEADRGERRRRALMREAEGGGERHSPPSEGGTLYGFFRIDFEIGGGAVSSSGIS